MTVIDYYSRYLLACHFTASYSAPEVATALDTARAEAERIHGPLTKTPFLVTDNGSSFLARHFRRHIDGRYAHVRTQYRTADAARIVGAVSSDAQDRGGVLEALQPIPGEARASLDVFRRRYNDLRLHWALVPPDGTDPLTPAAVYVHGRTVGLPK